MKSDYSLIAGIYKITNPAGRVYIGRSINIKKRWQEHKNKTSSVIYRSILKYGYENHVFEILVNTSVNHDLLNKLEIFFIKKYRSTDRKYGMNLSAGGGRLAFKHSEETILKMKTNRIGWKNSTGRILSSETKEKIRESLTGKKITIEALKKGENTRINKHISDVILDTETGIFYYSKREAVKYNRISRNTLTKRIINNLDYRLQKV